MKSETFGQRLKYVRESAGITQKCLATLTGLQPAAISHFETGHREPNMKNLCLLVRELAYCEYLVLGDD